MSKKNILKCHSNNQLLMHEHLLAERPLAKHLLAEHLLAERPLSERPLSERPLSELPLLKYLYIFADNQLLMSIPLLRVLSLSVS